MRVPARARGALRTAVFLFGVAVVLSPARPAQAAIGEGDLMPSLQAKEFVCGDAFTFEQARGKLVFCEVFSTG